MKIQNMTTTSPQKPRIGKNILGILFTGLLLIVIFWTVLYGLDVYYFFKFDIRPIYSSVDKDGDFLDDYTDIMLNARWYIRTQPQYVSTYFAGGYPPEGQGVCTDVIWRALSAAGYDFKAMIDADIAKYPNAYPLPDGMPDKNIDFRRVVNLQVYFGRHCQSLTTDASRIDQWQAGDIVFYNGHVAVVSDKRNQQGQPWIIHHTGHGAFEEDALTYQHITGHYRWTVNK